ncbi:hypothetical protein RHGRI_035321 [Rhododendron griersonianum]|uniref:Uncharacterized protein n=1 Tax=Rhododendron griersonianum TaxID=479676 RepID=A0AAV6I9V8_9ERIC|nr:hypothetical protein RHGRI_035321 [Rhododendron griersonianum]
MPSALFVSLLMKLTNTYSLNVLFPLLIVLQHMATKNMILDMPGSLVEVLDWYCEQVNGKSLKSIISLQCSLVATIYGLWRERNCQIFQGKVMGHDQVMRSIVADVRGFLSSRRKMKQSLENQSLYMNLGLSNRIFLSV